MTPGALDADVYLADLGGELGRMLARLADPEGDDGGDLPRR